ncbi:MAG TPA: NAD(P)H-dependent oxidoreductase subunit E [Anaerolineaceae bacterium]|nr:NAD(P)H-dependent oxidoreductase subunit E [Anaerolineaceae bacterium]
MTDGIEMKPTIYICMGSACHQCGVYEVLPILQALIHAYDLDDRIEMKGAFCLGECSKGVVVKLDETFIYDVHKNNVEEKVIAAVLERLKGVQAQ